MEYVFVFCVGFVLGMLLMAWIVEMGIKVKAKDDEAFFKVNGKWYPYNPKDM